MANVMDKIKNFRDSRPKPQNFKSQQNIFYQFKEGDNFLRLVGEFLQVKTHYLAPNAKFGDRGICIGEAFKGEGKIPYMVNCLDWDLEAEQPKAEKTCPICQLNRIVKNALKEAGKAIDPEDKKFLDKLARDTFASTSLKWNVIDRDDPHVLEVDDAGKEEQVLGYKVVNVGMEAWGDIDKIFSQLDIDISDKDVGVDINIERSHNGMRTTYSAQAVMEGMSVKQTPLNEEECAMKLHDLNRIAGKKTEGSAIINAMHEDLRDLLEDGKSNSAPEASTVPVEDVKEEAKTEAPKTEAPKTDVAFECFGTCDDPKHDECKGCSSLDECIVETAKTK